MTCIPHHHEVQVSILLEPSQIETTVLTPYLFGRGLPFLEVLPIHRVEVAQYPRSVDDEVILSVIDQDLKLIIGIEYPCQSLFGAAGEIGSKAVVDGRVGLLVADPVGHSEGLLIVLQIDFIVVVYVAPTVLPIVVHVHAQIIFVCNIFVVS